MPIPAGRAQDTFPKLLRRNAQLRAMRVAMREKEFGIWQSWTWAAMEAEIRNLAKGLAAIGLKRGQTLALVGDNRPKLYWAICAAQCLGGIPVPVYADSVAEEMAYVLDHAEVRFAVVEDQEQVDKLLSIADKVPSLHEIVYDEPRGMRDYDPKRLHDYEKVREAGLTRLKIDGAAEAWLAEIAKGRGSDLGIMLYTSGTTGRPKGVMLSNDNLVKSALHGNAFDHLTENETTIAYLPLAWVGDHVFSYSQSYTAGFCVACPESPETVTEDRREIAPTYFFAPPRVFEGLLTAMMVRMEDAGRTKKRMFDTFMAHARKVGEKILNGESVGAWDRLKYALGEFLVYGPVKNRMGLSRLRVAYTAGEAIGPELFRFYRAIGLNLKQLYGQTEATVYITAQPDGQIQADTVGLPSPGVEIRIADNGEVLYRSDGTFIGYYKNDQATAETKTPDGLLSHRRRRLLRPPTGTLKIIDRAKDVGRLTDGRAVRAEIRRERAEVLQLRQGGGRVRRRARTRAPCSSTSTWQSVGNPGPSATASPTLQLPGARQPRPEVYKIWSPRMRRCRRTASSRPSRMLAASQIRRFLVLHKELDADDGELTRTRRRCAAASSPSAMRRTGRGALRRLDVQARGDRDHLRGRPQGEDRRDGQDRRCAHLWRDGRTGAGGSGMNRPVDPRDFASKLEGMADGEVLLDLRNVSLAFGGVKAITDISFDIRKGEIRAIIGPNGAGKTSMLNVINGFYTPQKGTIVFRGRERVGMKPHHAVGQGIARTFQNVALFKGMSTLDNIMTGRSLKMKRGLGLADAVALGPGAARRRSRTAKAVERIIDFLEIQAHPPHAGRHACPMVCRSAWSWAVHSPPSPNCCCWTSRWPA
jgi:long-chain acyl-CoA synthetase